jgi:hypothetical protein
MANRPAKPQERNSTADEPAIAKAMAGKLQIYADKVQPRMDTNGRE